MSDILKAWYIFLGLCLLSFILMTFIGTVPYDLSSVVALPQQITFRVSSNLRTVLESARARHNFLTEISYLEKEVAKLKAQNRKLELKVERYQQVLGIREFQSPNAEIIASVIGIDTSALLSRLSLGVGAADGVTKYMPATVPEGLIGIVIDLTKYSAVVRTILDPQSRVGVTVRDKGGQGIALGESGNLVRVTGYYEEKNITVGDVVETQSRGGLFPRGILVGRVIQVFPKDPNSLYIDFLIRPAANIHNVLEVALIEPL